MGETVTAIEYVYVLTLVSTGKKYVGRTSHYEERKKQHLTALGRGKHNSKLLQHDYDTFGGPVKFELVGVQTTARQQFDLEKQTMVNLKTYDERYGYNTTEWAMNPFRRKAGLSYKPGNNKIGRRGR